MWTLTRTRWRLVVAILAIGSLISSALADYMADPEGERRVISFLGSPASRIVASMAFLYACWKGLMQGQAEGRRDREEDDTRQ
jgi:hypothetical protein